MIELELPYPPTINHYYGQKVNGGRYIKPKGKAFRVEVLARAFEKRACNHITSEIEVVIDAYPPDKRKRDLDNINKALLDALEEAGVFKDDSQIVKLTSIKHAPVKGGKVVVKVLTPESKAA
jgi:crossover junction endodeoxyribonuclease RusA